MKPLNSSNFVLVAIILLSGAITACQQATETAVGDRSKALTVSELSGDLPAQDAFSRLADRLGKSLGEPLSIKTYEVASLSETPSQIRAALSARGSALFGKTVPAEDIEFDAEGKLAETRDGEKVLEYNSETGSERFFDLSKHQRGAAVAQTLLPTDQEWIGRATVYFAKQVPALMGVKLRPFKIKKTFDAHSNGSGTVEDGVSQVAVAFNSEIDGWPLLASHPDLVVHMAPDGSVVGHEMDRRPTGRAIKTLKESELLPPHVARSRIEQRIGARGVNLQDFVQSKSLFGYLKLGRNDAQEALVPHYVLFYTPKEGVVSKVIVETEPAVSDADTLALVERDDARVKRRKSAITATPGRK